jgi:hypothetical protein
MRRAGESTFAAAAPLQASAVRPTISYRRGGPGWRDALSALALAAATPAFAQGTTPVVPQPLPVKIQDENGVDVVSGYVDFSVRDVAIGSLQHMLMSAQNMNSDPFQPSIAWNSGFSRYQFRSNYKGGAQEHVPFYNPSADSRPRMTISVAGISETFLKNPNGTYEAMSGGALVDNGCVLFQGGTRLYTSSIGVQVDIDCRIIAGGAHGTATQIRYPDGSVISMNYHIQPAGQYGTSYGRLQSVTASDGKMLKYTYSGTRPRRTRAISTCHP